MDRHDDYDDWLFFWRPKHEVADACSYKAKCAEVERLTEELAASRRDHEAENVPGLLREVERLRAAMRMAINDLGEHVADGCAGATGNARQGLCADCALAERLRDALDAVGKGE